MKLPILIAMVLYMAMVIWIGVIYSKKTKTSEDYFLGGRGLGPWVTAMSAEASDKPSETDKVINHIAMQQAFNSLDDSERRLIMLRYMQDKTQKQVAEVLGRNQVAISRMEKNTLAKLRRAMM